MVHSIFLKVQHLVVCVKFLDLERKKKSVELKIFPTDLHLNCQFFGNSNFPTKKPKNRIRQSTQHAFFPAGKHPQHRPRGSEFFWATSKRTPFFFWSGVANTAAALIPLDFVRRPVSGTFTYLCPSGLKGTSMNIFPSSLWVKTPCST